MLKAFKISLSILTVWLVALAAVGCGSSGNGSDYDPYQSNPADQLSNKYLIIDEAKMSAHLADDGLAVNVPIRQLVEGNITADIKLQLLDLNREPIGNSQETIEIKQLDGEYSFTISDLPEGFAEADKAQYLIGIQIDWDEGHLWGTRSLHAMYRYVQTQLLGTDDLFEGGRTYYKLLVHEPNSGQPVDGAVAELNLVSETDTVSLGQGETDEFGMADIPVSLPDGVFGSNNLLVNILLPGGEQQEQVMSPLSITREAKILLTTDKPLYQPGQTLHMRALCLKRPSLAPQAGLPVTLFVMDPKGNKVFKKQMNTSEYGVAATEFRLATLLNEGEYTIQAQIGEFFQEKTVTVEKYALPKFKVNFSTDRDYYRPGQAFHGTVQADYFFGKAVSGGSVEVVAYKFDVEMEKFANITGTTDQNGTFEFDVEALPTYFVGSALDENKAYVFFEITVTDTAGHAQTKSTSSMVVENAILLTVVPESGSVVPGVANSFYIITTDPFGRPVDAEATVSIDGDSISVNTGAWGLATFELTPGSESIELTVEAVTASGESAQNVFAFAAETAREYVLLRTDKATYKVGDSIMVSLFATNDGWDAIDLPDRIYLDVIKDGQTMLMTTVSLSSGKGTRVVDIDATMAGSLELMAYYLGAAGEIIRDRKLVFVELENSLTVEVIPEKDTFLPREEANITLRVKDHDAKGVQSVLGVQIVDEAVFALQDMKPGMEKIYFQLEDELLQPRYEIHGFNAEDMLEPEPDDSEEAERREAYAEAFLAAAGSEAGYSLNIDTFAGVADTAIATATTRVRDDLVAFITHLDYLLDAGFIADLSAYKAIVERHNFTDLIYDVWGRSYRLSMADDKLTFSSSGMDEKRGTADDIEVTESIYLNKQNDRNDWDADGGEGEWDDALAGGGDGDFADPSDEPPEANADGDDGYSNGEEEGPVVRSYFPETLYVNPSLVTDRSGEVNISVEMADSITSWRMTALASSLEGQIGSAVGNVIVFQDFFVDIDFPATLTQNDIVHVPIAIYNYLPTQQTIRLEAEAGSWLEFLENQTVTVNVGPNSVIGIYFPVKVVEVGWHDFTVYGYGSEASDAIRRKVEVVPDGLEVREASSGRLDGNKTISINIPEKAIDGASKLWVKIYPGLFSQVVEGLDSMLQMPSGCFEQTSSTTYPNILALDYMVLTDQLTPEIELRARDYISQGYQRLLSYEVDGGGFEWFGDSPAHRALTAYGLLEFFDMSKVHDVDDAVITRTQNWLTTLQNGDGSYDADPGGIHEGATNNFTKSKLRTTSYISYALAESGYTGAALDRGVNWIKQNLMDEDDNYTLGMIAMLLATVGGQESALNQVIEKLYDARNESEDGKVYWGQEAQTEMYGTGDSASLETTALIGQAFIRANAHLNLMTGITDWLLTQKGSFGQFCTTQGTIQALRFMIASLGAEVEESSATIAVTANGDMAGTVSVTPANSEVLQLIDLTQMAKEGANSVELVVAGEGNIMYSVVSSYWLPSEEDPYQQTGPLEINVAYDKTNLEVNDTVTATVTISNMTSDVVRMLLVDIGLPPGFDLMSDMLDSQVLSTDLQRWEKAGRQLILYIERIDGNADMVLTFQMQARFPMEGSSGPASASPYYEPESESTAQPTFFTVTEGS